ncbi:signal peptidase II [uncultured Tyzzerella sp.]|uniref:signal peptidase II n=1 Tax=uncultured Tyzzerella sp. TaxID=2321398 RepID=UPI002942ECC3|nr:signal peptidase II [uncultured Tyzzerella sp.]
MIYFFIIIILILLDLGSKSYVKRKYKLNEDVSIYKDKVYICHIKNEGLAYGVLKNSKKFIYIIVSVCLLLVGILFYSAFKEGSKLKKLSFSFALGGALGNFIDRIKNKNITDFIYIKYKKAPIFNLADVFLFISPILLFINEIKDIISKKQV